MEFSHALSSIPLEIPCPILNPQPPYPLAVWIFFGIAHFSTVQKFCHFCNDSNDELKNYPNKKDWLLQSKNSYNYSIEKPKGDSGTASAYEIKNTSCLKMI